MRPFTELRFSDRVVGIINFDPTNSFDISSATHSFIKGNFSLKHIFILVISPISVTSVVEFCGPESTGAFSKKISTKKFCFDFHRCSHRPSKISSILENKVVQKLKFSKNNNNKKHPYKLIFFNEKKIRKI